jgi:hypothetical protein
VTGGQTWPSRAPRLRLALALGALCLAGTAFAGDAETGGGAGPLRLAVIGDINQSYGTVGYAPEARAAVRRIVAMRPDAVLGVGDLIAGQRVSPRLDRSRIESMWDAFNAEILAPLNAAGIHFLPVPGNHDASAEPGFALERRLFVEQWNRNRPEVEIIDGEGYPLRYAAAMRGVLIIVLDATTPGPLPAPQREWAARTLHAATGLGVRLVAGHIPIRAFAYGREREVLGDGALEAVLQGRGVDAYLSGHHHAFYPGVWAGLLHVSQGCLGAGPRKLIGAHRRSPRSFTLISVDAGGDITLEAYAEPDFAGTISRTSLPASIFHGGVRVVRDDLSATLDRR